MVLFRKSCVFSSPCTSLIVLKKGQAITARSDNFSKLFKSVCSDNNAQKLTFESYCLSSGEQKGRMFDKQLISKKYRRDETTFDI